MSTSASPHDPLICNTTPIRIFTIVGQIDLLVELLGGTVHVPRQVLDPDDDFATPPDLLSEIGATERFFATRSVDSDRGDIRARLAGLRTRSEIDVVDLSAVELDLYAELRAPGYVRRVRGLAGTLGRGEAAAMAIAETRSWAVAMDDAVAREVLAERSPATTIVTSHGLLRQAVGRELIDSGSAQLVYDDMLAKGYRGPEQFF